MGTDNAGMELIASGLQFPEGPIWLRDGRVLVVEIKTGHARRGRRRTAPSSASPRRAAARTAPPSAPTARSTSATTAGSSGTSSNGIVAPGPQPADYIGGRIQRVDIDTGEVEDLYTEVDGNPLRGPNDIVFDAEGGFYFTDLGKSRARDVDKAGVYYAKADGSSVTELVYGLDHANGIALSPDGRHLYVAETITGRLWTWEIESPGVFTPPAEPVGHGTLLYSFDGYQLLDSMAVDARRQRVRRDADHGRRQRRVAGREAARPVQGAGAGPVRHERVLRRRRPARRRTSRRRAAACCTRWRGPAPATRCTSSAERWPPARSSWPAPPASSATPRSSTSAGSTAGTSSACPDRVPADLPRRPAALRST